MSLLQQLVQFLSQPPDSLVYHVIILLALQATFWLALYHLRRRPDDQFSRRLVWASAGMMVGRLILLVAALAVYEVNEAASILPPLERAIDTATAALLVWALAPQFKGATRLGDAILLIVLLLTGFIYIFFANEWLHTLQSSNQQSSYLATPQAAAWDILQLVILGAGGVLIVIAREGEWQLRIATVATLIASHVVSLFSQSFAPVAGTEVAYWIRLGNLITFPLLAILTYRYNISHMLPSGGFGRSWVDHLDYLLHLTRNTIGSREFESTLERSLKMVTEVIAADFSALAIRDSNDSLSLQITGTSSSKPSEIEGGEVNLWVLELGDWPAFDAALKKNEQVELLPKGAGARQAHRLYQRLELDSMGPLLITPLMADKDSIGLLLLAGSKHWEQWPEADKMLAQSVAEFLATALQNVRLNQLAKIIGSPENGDLEPRPESRIISLQQEFDRALNQVSSLKGRVTALESQLANERSRAEHLTDRLAASHYSAMVSEINEQEDEIAALKEALVQAEEAMAQAAASDAGLSAEWVMRTVTRYSGELEDTQARINLLEAQLSNSSDGHEYGRFMSRIRQLRTPLTSLGVYTNLLLSESLGELGSRQMSLVGRMRSNIDRMTAMVDQISISANQVQIEDSARQYVDVRETIEAAISAVGMQIKRKRLTLDLDIEEKLPTLPSNNGSLYEIVTHLLDGTCRVSRKEGRLTLIAHRESVSTTKAMSRPTSFLHIAVSGDNVAIGSSIHAYLVSGGELAPELLDDSNLKPAIDSLSVALQLATAYGGRTWVEYDSEVGSIVSVLLPESLEGVSVLDESDVQ
jgi:signal transduction histidine kinase